ncbi:uncharacterized protein [Typha angustifolia]|uniref:uncharacterized protein isoform X1 n=2 Tax=Typha angustifolia TaxID=59011 RepID=UPI003C2AB842
MLFLEIFRQFSCYEMDSFESCTDLASLLCSRRDPKDFLFDEDEIQAMDDDDDGATSITGELSTLVEAIREDNTSQLISLTEADHETLDPLTIAHLLRLACKLDSVECAKVFIEGEIGTAARINERDGSGRTPLQIAAEMHSANCIDLLLRKNARTDIISKDGLALEIALSCKRMQVDWSPNESIEELVTLLREKDLSAIKLLAMKTREVAEIVCTSAIEGRAVALATLLLVIEEKITAPMVVKREGTKRNKTIYESVLDEALALVDASDDRREALLRVIELLHLFGAATASESKERGNLPPLLRASQVGDASVIKILLKEDYDVNATDFDGNTSLHWCLTGSPNSKDPRIVWLLLRYGAKASHRNRLGLTPVHVAAAKGNFDALQLLLRHAPECIDIASETKETPLFFAVKSDSLDCAKLLLRFGANSQALNLRRQRPVDFAKSQDMRFILNPTNHGAWGCSSRNDGLNLAKYEQLLELGEAALTGRQTQLKSPVCRFYESRSGCVRGAKCYYAHGEVDRRGVKYVSKNPFGLKGDFRRKVFVGGLPLTVDSEYLKEFFHAEFGPVEDAVVIETQAGGQTHSRGFGFVKFEKEETVVAALETHFIIIFGKKVEIKSAVAKPTLSSDEPAEKQGRQMVQSFPEKILPAWFLKFRKWLPLFLMETCKRLGEGEWYPLSSLKGDFRVTCRMELDHASLGFPKLSDFMRAIPGICQMRIVPVGNGPATHMVLQPSRSVTQHVPLLTPLSKQDDDYTVNSSVEESSSRTSGVDFLDSEYTVSKIACHGDHHSEEIGVSSNSNGAGQSFSFFQTQWDRNPLAFPECGSCILCQSLEASFQLIPCLHKVCGICMMKRTFEACKICGAFVHNIKPCPSEPDDSDMGIFGEQSQSWQRPMPTFSGMEARRSPAEPKCQYIIACQGAKAIASCLPCGHAVSCHRCIPALARMPKICVICGNEVESFMFSED